MGISRYKYNVHRFGDNFFFWKLQVQPPSIWNQEMYEIYPYLGYYS